MDNAIVLKGVSKKYSLTKERPLLLKNLFIPSKKEEIWALKDVSLEIKKGETIGIIGENGSGKSTLLKIISGITTPTSGKVEVNGRVASLIELGAGFHPDLTGRENVYLNGTLLGLTKKEIDRKYREIVEFADIPEFIDQPVRTYSSGMTVRLGFSVAVHLDPDILLIDEVLAVGDEEFQRKCIEKINEFRKKKITILIVSHNLFLITELCNKSILMSDGEILKKSISIKTIDYYLNFIEKNCTHILNNSKINKSRKIFIKKISFYDINNNRKLKFNIKDSIVIELIYKNNFGHLKTCFGFMIYNNQKKFIYGFSTNLIDTKKGEGKLIFLISELPSVKGKLFFKFDIADLIKTIKYDSTIKSYNIDVMGEVNSYRGLIDFMCKFSHKQ